MNDSEQDCCSCRTKHRSEKEERDLLNRLNRIEGQIRGIRGMVEKEAYCPDILTQVAAASAAAEQLFQGSPRQPHQNLRRAGYSRRQGRNHRRAFDHAAKADALNEENIRALSPILLLKGVFYGTIYRNRHELCRLQCPG